MPMVPGMLIFKGPFNECIDKMCVCGWGLGAGQKMSVFVHGQGIKTFHAGGGGNGKILST